MPEILITVVYFSIYIGLIATTFYILSFIAEKKKKKLLYEDHELPKVTVIIPAYNEEKTISKTLNSILDSDYPDFEVIFVDDGSMDKTLQVAKKFKKVRIFHKENGGKGSALNLGISKARGEIIFTMDADTTVDPQSMKNMVRLFKDKSVMSVTPAMIIDNPKTVLQKVQYVEYLLGLFLRKAFASVRSIFVAPGAFSAYRKEFFDKYGGYDVGNVTEDLEIALRIQFKGFHTENCPEAPAYTIAPSKFKDLLIQRRRWYFGLIKNLWNYRKIISPKYGDLGVFVIPVAMISIFLAVFVTVYLLFKTLFSIRKDLLFLQSINFDFANAFDLNFYIVERFLFSYISNPILIFVLIFVGILSFYMFYASRKIGKLSGIIFNIILFFLFFSILFGFWWIVSIFYVIFNKKIKWK